MVWAKMGLLRALFIDQRWSEMSIKLNSLLSTVRTEFCLSYPQISQNFQCYFVHRFETMEFMCRVKTEFLRTTLIDRF